MSNNYYSQKLSSSKLQQCYELASSRVKRFLQAEIEFVLTFINPEDEVLELGCGYGRVLQSFLGKAKRVVGIDTSADSLEHAHAFLGNKYAYELYRMNAINLDFEDGEFDVVICIQNGISAFHEDKREIIKEAVRVTKSGGKVLFSSYSPNFWKERLQWFQAQAEHGLLGEIDEDKTGNGNIVCKDGFTATTVSQQEFLELTSDLNVSAQIREKDNSSIFCVMSVL